jgi:ABC-type glutathione transport system ATPase component
VVFVEQYVSLALRVADFASVLNRGTIVLAGSATEVASQPDRLERAYLGTSGPLAEKTNVTCTSDKAPDSVGEKEAGTP